MFYANEAGNMYAAGTSNLVGELTLGLGTSTANGQITADGVGSGLTGSVIIDDELTVNGNIELQSTLTDINGSVGAADDILISTTLGVDWVDIATLLHDLTAGNGINITTGGTFDGSADRTITVDETDNYTWTGTHIFNPATEPVTINSSLADGGLDVYASGAAEDAIDARIVRSGVAQQSAVIGTLDDPATPGTGTDYYGILGGKSILGSAGVAGGIMTNASEPDMIAYGALGAHVDASYYAGYFVGNVNLEGGTSDLSVGGTTTLTGNITLNGAAAQSITQSGTGNLSITSTNANVVVDGVTFNAGAVTGVTTLETSGNITGGANLILNNAAGASITTLNGQSLTITGTGTGTVTVEDVAFDGNGIASTTLNTNLTLSANGTGVVNVNDALTVVGTTTLSGFTTAGIVLNNASGVLSTGTALPTGTTATTETAGDNTTKVATDAFVTGAITTLSGSKFLTYGTDANLSAEEVLTAGNGITLTEGTGTMTIAAKLDGSTLANGVDGLKVNTSGITANEIATSAVGTDEILNATILPEDLSAQTTTPWVFAANVDADLGLDVKGAALTVGDGTNTYFSVNQTNGTTTIGTGVAAISGTIKADGVNASPGITPFETGVVLIDDEFTVNGATTLNTTLAVTGISTLTGLLNANGGIDVDAGNFTVDGTTGAVVTKSTIVGASSLTLGTSSATPSAGTVVLYDGEVSGHHFGTIAIADLGDLRTWTFPDLTGTVALTANNLSAFAATTSAQLAGVISDEVGTGALVFATSPTLVTPNIGVATATSINGNTITASTGTLTLAAGKTLSVGGNFTTTPGYDLTLTTSANTNVTLPTTGTLATLAGAEALTNKTVNGLSLSPQAIGFAISGGTTSKTLIVSNDANVSGTNTGDQTVTLTGDITGSGSGNPIAVTTTIANKQPLTATLPVSLSGTTTVLASTPIVISVGDADANSTTKGVATFKVADFEATAGLISLDYANAQKATSVLDGFLTNDDWTLFNGKQTGDATLTSIALLGTAADRMLYTTGVDTWAEATITSFGRSILDDVDAAAVRTTIGAEPTLTKGNLTATGPISVSGARQVIGGAADISIASAAADGSTLGAAAFTAADFNAALGVISLDYANAQKATAGQPGFLTAADWTSFNAKESALTFSTGLTRTINTITVNPTQNITNLSNLSTNGIVTTSGSNGTLGVVATLPIANGGTNSSTALNNGRIMVSSGGAIVEGTAGTTTQVLHGNAGGAPTYGAVVAGDLDPAISISTTGNITTTGTGALTVAGNTTLTGKLTMSIAAIGNRSDLDGSNATIINYTDSDLADNTLVSGGGDGQLRTGVEGEVMYVVNGTTLGAISVCGVNVAIGKTITLIYAGGIWRPII